MTENNVAAAAGGTLGGLGAEVEESLHPMLSWIVAHIKLIVGVVAALLIAVGAVAVYDAVQSSRMAEQRAALTDILAEADASARAAKLETFAGNAPDALRTAVQLELASALSAAGEHDRAAAVWSGLTSGDLGTVAQLGKAAELSRAGKHAEALAVLQGMTADAPKAYTLLLYERLAYEAEAQGDLAAAVSAWESLLAENQGSSDSFITAKIKQLRARLDG